GLRTPATSDPVALTVADTAPTLALSRYVALASSSSPTPVSLIGNGDSEISSMSADGRYVAFYSSASNLVPGDTNGSADVFVKDLLTGSVVRASTDAAGAQANFDSYSPTLSADGRYVAFYSSASNLVPGDTNGSADVFVKDLLTGSVVRASTDAAGAQ